MTIHITDCANNSALFHATVEDIYGGSYYTDSFGNLQVTPGYESAYLGTLIQVSSYTYLTAEFTLTSLGVNSFCLTKAPEGEPTEGAY